MISYKVGDVVKVKMPGGGAFFLRVTSRSPNIVGSKIPGFEGHLIQNPERLHWGYDKDLIELAPLEQLAMQAI